MLGGLGLQKLFGKPFLVKVSFPKNKRNNEKKRTVIPENEHGVMKSRKYMLYSSILKKSKSYMKTN